MDLSMIDNVRGKVVDFRKARSVFNKIMDRCHIVSNQIWHYNAFLKISLSPM